MPSISVIMTVLNGEKFISKSIDSLFAQSYQNWELIIINDGSTDDTENIIKTFNSLKIKIITNKSTMGTSHSRNTAITKAEGKYIAILDADDIALPKRLEIQKDILEKNSHIGLVSCRTKNINENGALLPEKNVDPSFPFPVESTYIKWRLLWTNVIGHSTVMFRKSVFIDVNGYDPSLPFAADLSLWTSMAQITDVFQIPQVLVHYRIHPDMMTYNKTEEIRELEKFKACQNGFETLLKRKVQLITVKLAVNGWRGGCPETVGEFNKMRAFIMEVYTTFKNKYFYQNEDGFKQVKQDMLRTMLLWQFYYYDLTGIWDRGISWEIINKLGNNALSSKRFYQQLFKGTVIQKFYSSLLTK